MATGRTSRHHHCCSDRNQVPVTSERGCHDLPYQGNRLPVHYNAQRNIVPTYNEVIDLPNGPGDAFYPGQHTDLRISRAPLPQMESFPYYRNGAYIVGNKNYGEASQQNTVWPERGDHADAITPLTHATQKQTREGGCYPISSSRTMMMASPEGRCLPEEVFHYDQKNLPSCLYPKPVRIKLNVKPAEKPAELMEAAGFVARSRSVRVSVLSSSDSAEQISLKLLHDDSVPETEAEPENIEMPSELMPSPPPPDEVVEVNLLPVGDSKVAHMKEHCSSGVAISRVGMRILGYGACVGLEIANQFAVCSLRVLNNGLHVYGPIVTKAAVTSFKGMRRGCKVFLHKSAPIASHAKEITLACFRKTEDRCIPAIKKAWIACFSFGEDSEDEIDDFEEFRPPESDRPSHYDDDLAWKDSLRVYPESKEEPGQPDSDFNSCSRGGGRMESTGENPQDRPTPELSIFEGYPYYMQQRDAFQEDNNGYSGSGARSVVPFQRTVGSIGCYRDHLSASRRRLPLSPAKSKQRRNQGLGALAWQPPDIRDFTDPLRAHLLVERLKVRPEPRHYRDLIQKPPLGDECLWRSTLRAYLKDQRADVRPEDVLLSGKAIPMKLLSRVEFEGHEEDHSEVSDKRGKIPIVGGFAHYSEVNRSAVSPPRYDSHKRPHDQHQIRQHSPSQISLAERKVYHSVTTNKRHLQKFLPNRGKDIIKQLGNSRPRRLKHDEFARYLTKSHDSEKLMRKEDSSRTNVSSVNSQMEDGDFWQSFTIHSSDSDWKALSVSQAPHHGKKRPHSPQPSLEEVPHVEMSDNSSPAHPTGKHQKLEVLSAPESLMTAKFSKRPLKISSHRLSDSDCAKVGSPAESGRSGRSLNSKLSPSQSPYQFIKHDSDEISPTMMIQSKERRFPSFAKSPLTPSKPFRLDRRHAARSTDKPSNLHFYGHCVQSNVQSPADIHSSIWKTPRKGDGGQGHQYSIHRYPYEDLKTHGSLVDPKNSRRSLSSPLRSLRPDLDSKRRSRCSMIKGGLSFLWPFSLSSKRLRMRSAREKATCLLPSKSPIWNLPSKGKSRFSIFTKCRQDSRPHSGPATPPMTRRNLVRESSEPLSGNSSEKRRDPRSPLPSQLESQDHATNLAKFKRPIPENDTTRTVKIFLSRGPSLQKGTVPMEWVDSRERTPNLSSSLNSTSGDKRLKSKDMKVTPDSKLNIQDTGETLVSKFFTPEKTYFRHSFRYNGDENKISESPKKLTGQICQMFHEPGSVLPKADGGAIFNGAAEKQVVPVAVTDVSPLHDEIELRPMENIHDHSKPALTTGDTSKSVALRNLSDTLTDRGPTPNNVGLPGSEDDDAASSSAIRYQRNPEVSKLLTAYKEALMKDVKSPHYGILEREKVPESRTSLTSQSDATQQDSYKHPDERFNLEYIKESLGSSEPNQQQEREPDHIGESANTRELSEGESVSDSHHNSELVKSQTNENIGQFKEAYPSPDDRNADDASGVPIADHGRSFEFQSQQEHVYVQQDLGKREDQGANFLASIKTVNRTLSLEPADALQFTSHKVPESRRVFDIEIVTVEQLIIFNGDDEQTEEDHARKNDEVQVTELSGGRSVPYGTEEDDSLPPEKYFSNDERSLKIEEIINLEENESRPENRYPLSDAKVEEKSRRDDAAYLKDDDNQLGFPSSRSAELSEVKSEISPSEKRNAFRLIAEVEKDLEYGNAFDVVTTVGKELYHVESKPATYVEEANEGDSRIERVGVTGHESLVLFKGNDLDHNEGGLPTENYSSDNQSVKRLIEELITLKEDMNKLESESSLTDHAKVEEKSHGDDAVYFKDDDNQIGSPSSRSAESSELSSTIFRDLIELSYSSTEGEGLRSRSFDSLSSESQISGTEVRVRTIIDEERIVVESEKTFDRLVEQLVSDSSASTLSQGSSGATSVPARSKTGKSFFLRPVLKKSLVADSETEKILAQLRLEENQAAQQLPSSASIQDSSSTNIAQRLNINSRDEKAQVRRSSSFDGLPGRSDRVIGRARSRNFSSVRPFIAKSVLGDAETEQTFESQSRSEQPDAETSSRLELRFNTEDGRETDQADRFLDGRSSGTLAPPTRSRTSLFTRPVLKRSLVADSETEQFFAGLKPEENKGDEDTRSEGGDSNENPVSSRPRKSLFTRPVLKRSLVADSQSEELLTRLQFEQSDINSSEQLFREGGGSVGLSASLEGLVVGEGSSSSFTVASEESNERSAVRASPAKSLFTRPMLKQSLVVDAETVKLFTQLQSGQNEFDNTRSEQGDVTRSAAFEGLLFGSRSSPLSSSEGSDESSTVPARSRKSLFTRPVLKRSLVANSETERLFTQLSSERTEFEEDTRSERSRFETREGGRVSRSASFAGLPKASRSSDSPTNSEGSDVPVRPRKSFFERPLLKRSLVAGSTAEKLLAQSQSERSEAEEQQLDTTEEGSGIPSSSRFEGLQFASRTSPSTSSEGTDASSVPTRPRKSLFTRPVLKKSLEADSGTKTVLAQLQSKQNKLEDLLSRTEDTEEPQQQSSAAEGQFPRGPPVRFKSSLKRSLSIPSDRSLSQNQSQNQQAPGKRVKFETSPEDTSTDSDLDQV